MGKKIVNLKFGCSAYFSKFEVWSRSRLDLIEVSWRLKHESLVLVKQTDYDYNYHKIKYSKSDI